VLDSGLTELNSGRARGPLLGGNIEVLTRLVGTPFEPDFSDAILFLEEVNEPPYRLDRLLTHLELAGVFDRIVGIVIGELCGCDRTTDGEVESPTSDDVVAERLGRLEIPVALNGSFGHGKRNLALPYGTIVELDTSAGSLTALESPVS
jgi:muramoyltetrapeptide carboxypeptidase